MTENYRRMMNARGLLLLLAVMFCANARVEACRTWYGDLVITNGPAAYDMGIVYIGGVKERIFTVQNVGCGPAFHVYPAMNGDAQLGINYSKSTCVSGQKLDPGASCYVTVVFRPGMLVSSFESWFYVLYEWIEYPFYEQFWAREYSGDHGRIVGRSSLYGTEPIYPVKKSIVKNLGPNGYQIGTQYQQAVTLTNIGSDVIDLTRLQLTFVNLGAVVIGRDGLRSTIQLASNLNPRIFSNGVVSPGVVSTLSPRQTVIVSLIFSNYPNPNYGISFTRP